ncbi:MAG TPA: amidohydrolase family protein, partial [Planctomycetota bacterium]|nr:amidohydrolase family protein [Planctomycetota bacterium]
ASLRQLAADGCTALGEIDSTGAGCTALLRSPLLARCYQELTGFHLDAEAARALVRARWQPAVSEVVAGLSPHAPYSVSPALFAAAAAQSRWLQVHCAETMEEVQFLRSGRGPFRELLARLGRLPAGFRSPRATPVGWLRQHGVLRRGTVLVHCQHLQRGDRGLIARAGATIAVCPGTIVWFRRPPPPVADWLAAGIPVALGTDSRASNTALSMRRELVAAAALWPGLPPRTLLAMATSHGGKALGLAAGALRPGRRADLFAVRADTDSADALLELLVQGEREVAFTCVRGRVWPARSRTPC